MQHVCCIVGQESKGWVFVPANSRTVWRNSQQITRCTLQTRTETSAESSKTYFSVNENDSLSFYSVASFFLTHTHKAQHHSAQTRPCQTQSGLPNQCLPDEPYLNQSQQIDSNFYYTALFLPLFCFAVISFPLCLHIHCCHPAIVTYASWSSNLASWLNKSGLTVTPHFACENII